MPKHLRAKVIRDWWVSLFLWVRGLERQSFLIRFGPMLDYHGACWRILSHDGQAWILVKLSLASLRTSGAHLESQMAPTWIQHGPNIGACWSRMPSVIAKAENSKRIHEHGLPWYTFCGFEGLRCRRRCSTLGRCWITTLLHGASCPAMDMLAPFLKLSFAYIGPSWVHFGSNMARCMDLKWTQLGPTMGLEPF